MPHHMEGNVKYTGRCVCEKISYQIDGELGPIFNCHCSKCRRWHGAVFRTRASVSSSQFRWLSGEELLSYYYSSDTARKSFCSNCGSALTTTYDDSPDVVGVPIAALEQAPRNRPEANIFVGSKATWYEITDGLPQHEKWPGSEAKVRETKA